MTSSEPDVFERDGYRCILCGIGASRDGRYALVNAHVRPDYASGPYDKRNLITLCPTCHTLFDQLRAFWFDKDSGALVWQPDVQGIDRTRYARFDPASLRKNIERGYLEYRERWAKRDPTLIPAPL